MAKAPAAPKAEAAEPVPIAPQRSKKLLIIGVALVVVVLLLLAGVAGLLMLKKAKTGGGEHADEVETTAPFDLSKPPAFVALDSFVVNLAPDEGERYLQAAISLRVADDKTGESIKGVMPIIRDEINKTLSSKLPSELSRIEGREQLADEIVERTNRALGGSRAKGADPKAPAGPVQAVLFNSFIIQ